MAQLWGVSSPCRDQTYAPWSRSTIGVLTIGPPWNSTQFLIISAMVPLVGEEYEQESLVDLGKYLGARVKTIFKFVSLILNVF